MSDYLDILAEKREKWMNRTTLMTNQTPPEATCRISGRVLGHVRVSYQQVSPSPLTSMRASDNVLLKIGRGFGCWYMFYLRAGGT